MVGPSLERERRMLSKLLCTALVLFSLGSGRPSRERRCPRSLGTTWTTRVSGE